MRAKEVCAQDELDITTLPLWWAEPVPAPASHGGTLQLTDSTGHWLPTVSLLQEEV